MARRRALGAAVLLGALGALVAGAPGVAAHALLRDSTPGDGALLDTPPPAVVMTFTEPPDLGLSEVRVVDQTGRPVAGGPPRAVPGSDRRVRLPLPTLERGVYTVSWRVLSRVDGHLTSGAFSFGVGVEAASLPPPVAREGPQGGYPAPSPLSVAGRWAFYWGMALLVGGAVALGALFRGPVPGATALLAAGWAAAAAGLGAMLLAERAAAGVSVLALLGSDRGEVLIARAAAVAAAGVGIPFLRRSPARSAMAVGVGSGAALLVHAYAGHAGASASWLEVGVQWIHLVAVGVWIGGLPWALAAARGLEPEARGHAVRRFSRLAGYAVLAVAATGAVRAVNAVGWSPGRLVDTGFGLSVLAKVVLFGGLVSLGAVNRYRVVPRLAAGGRRVLGWTVGGEMAIAAGVFGVTGLMTALPPPALLGGGPAPAPDRVVAVASDFATTVRVRLTAAPGVPGPNIFQVRVQDYDTGQPVPARLVTLRFSLPGRPDVRASELPLAPVAPGLWEARGTNLSVPGTWRIGVLVQQAADSLEVPVALATRPPPQRVEVSEGGPGAPDLYTIHVGQGRAVQGYVDPGAPGPNELHITFFDAGGGELPVEEARVEAVSPSGRVIPLQARRLDRGHFAAAVNLEPGRWRFRTEATAGDGTVVTAYFDQEVER